MKKKILLIDDNQDIHLMIGYFLRRAGYDLESAYDGEEGLRVLRTYKPDLVILDYMMPKKNGPTIFKEFISDPIYKDFHHVPFVMLTAKQTDEKDINEMLESGMTAFLYKPFGQNELINIIQNILKTHQIQIQKQTLFSAIHNAKEFLSNLVENIPNALFIVNQKGMISFYNGGHQDILEYSEDDVLDKPFKLLINPEKANIEKSEKIFDFTSKVKNLEIFLNSKSGKSVPFSIQTSPLESEKDNNSGVVVIGTDISEIKKLEKMLIEQEKLATLTETAIAVNHEINNPLMPIIGNLQLLLSDKTKFDEKTYHRFEAMFRNAMRIQETTKKLRRIKQPVQKSYIGETQMLDIQKSS
jgi:two-component system, NtrC family, sensor kinase